MFTIFTFPRPFQSPFNTPQLNAINSWKKIHKDIEIYLINDELNTAKEFAIKNEIKCIDGKFSKYGSPLLKDAIQSINSVAKNDVILFINTDIIYLDGIKRTMDIVLNNFDKYFIVGRRVDYDIDYKISFSDEDYKKKLITMHENGDMHGLSGLDYWIFPKNTFNEIPDFVIGKPGYDNWLLAESKRKSIPVIDASNTIRILHQNHYYPQKKSDSYKIEYDENLKKAGNLLGSLRNSDFVVDSSFLLKKPNIFYQFFDYLNDFRLVKILLNIIRQLRSFRSKNAKR